MNDMMAIYALDDLGPLMEPRTEPVPVYDFKAMTAFCENIGKTKAELTDEERDQFILYWSPPPFKARKKMEKKHER